MIFPASSYGVDISAKLGDSVQQAHGVCFGNAINCLRSNNTSLIAAGCKISEIKFCIPQGTTPEQLKANERTVDDKSAKMWLGIGKKMFGWDYNIDELIARQKLEPIWLELPGDMLNTEAYFQVCWLRFPYEMPIQFDKFMKLLEKAPVVFRNPTHPVFWLMYLSADIGAPNSNHDMMPLAGTYVDEYARAFFRNGISRNVYGYLLSGGYRNIMIPMIMAEFCKDRNKYVACKELTLEMAIQTGRGLDVKLWKSMANAWPNTYSIYPFVKTGDLLCPSIKKLVAGSFSGLQKALSDKNIAEKMNIKVKSISDVLNPYPSAAISTFPIIEPKKKRGTV